MKVLFLDESGDHNLSVIDPQYPLFVLGGVIVAEKRDPTLDRELDLAWLNLKVQGTRHMQAKEIDRRIIGLNLPPKSDNIAGLQLADLVVTPIGRYVLGKPTKEDFQIVESKFRRNQHGDYVGYGLVVLPT